MERTSLYVGKCLINNNSTTWRVIYVNTSVVMIEMGISKTVMQAYSLSDMQSMIDSGEFKSSDIDNESSFYFDVNLLSDKNKTFYEKTKKFIDEFNEIYGPDFMEFGSYIRSNSIFTELYSKHNLTPPTAYKIIRRWLQSGLQDGSWLDPRVIKKSKSRNNRKYNKKPGKPGVYTEGITRTEEVIEAFEYGISLYKKIRGMTKIDSYNSMINAYFTKVNPDGSKSLFPEGCYPSVRQYLYYLSTRISQMEQIRIKTSIDEYNNNYRLLFGFNRESAIKPGYILEADAVEVGFHIVSKFNNQQNISKPIVYMLIDLYSHAIVACHVSFDNNDMIALSSLIMNLFEDKRNYLEAHNITNVDLEYWPSMFIPHEIRCDRGSDFASDQFEKMCSELNITRTIEHGAMGSMKGLIERSFGQFQSGIRPFLENKGVVQFRYDSNHQKQACLNIEHIVQLVVMFIIEHNRHYFNNWNLTPEMKNVGVEKTPISVWNYGIEYEGSPERITPFNYLNSLYKLMPEARATLTREGVKFNNLIYRVSLNSELAKKCQATIIKGRKRDANGNLLNSIIIRYDPRSIDNIYYLEKNQVISLPNAYDKNGQYKHCTWEEYEEQVVIDKINGRVGKRRNLEDSVNRITSIANMSSNSFLPTYASTKDVNKWRKIDKNDTNFENRIEKKILENKNNENMISEISTTSTHMVEHIEKTMTLTKTLPETSVSMVAEKKETSIPSFMKKDSDNTNTVVTSTCPVELCDFD